MITVITYKILDKVETITIADDHIDSILKDGDEFIVKYTDKDLDTLHMFKHVISAYHTTGR